MSTSIILRHANYGLELVDALTDGPLLGASAVSIVGSDAEPFLVNASRWVFEGLPSGAATFVITADLYLPKQVATSSTELPDDVPDSDVPGILGRVVMTPCTGYPFSPTLTRVVGQVFLDPSVDPTTPPVVGATVTITARHHHFTPLPATTVDDPDVVISTTENGQYTFWFFADPTKDPPLPNEVLVTAQSGSLTGTFVTPVTLIAGGVTDAPAIYLS